jgi:hypothetical protein
LAAPIQIGTLRNHFSFINPAFHAHSVPFVRFHVRWTDLASQCFRAALPFLALLMTWLALLTCILWHQSGL